VLVHGVRVADYPGDAYEENARRIKAENARQHPGLKIKGVRWLGRVEGNRDYAPLVVEVESVEQANRLIREGMVMKYDLKMVETYNSKCRLTQCFKCQRYGHTSLTCKSQQKCGYCGGGHITEQCADKTQATHKRCAACDGGEHMSWSQACPAR